MTATNKLATTAKKSNTRRCRKHRRKPRLKRATAEKRAQPRRLKALRKKHVRDIKYKALKESRKTAKRVIKREGGQEILSVVLGLQELLKRFGLKQRIESLHDPRVVGRSQYSMYDMIMTGLLMQFFRSGSRNNFEQMRIKCYFEHNLKLLLGINLPHTDTLHAFLDKLDADVLPSLGVSIVKQMMKANAFAKCKFKGKFEVAIDATGNGKVGDDLDPEDWATVKESKLGKVSKHREFIKAELLGPNSLRLPLYWGPIEQQDGHKKQDCELRAAHRLLDKIYKEYPRTQFIFLLDSLYANRPFLDKIIRHGGSFIVNWKQGSNPLLFKDAESSMIDNFEENYVLDDIEVSYYDGSKDKINRDVAWSNRLSLGGIEIQMVSVLESNVPMSEFDSANPRHELKNFVFMTDIKVDSSNAVAIETLGRKRWQIEHGFNHSKNLSSQINHKFSRKSVTASKNYLTLLFLAECFEILIMYSTWFIQAFNTGKDTVKDAWSSLIGVLRFTDITADMVSDIPQPPKQLAFIERTYKMVA